MSSQGSWIRRNVAETSPEGLKCRRKVARRLEMLAKAGQRSTRARRRLRNAEARPRFRGGGDHTRLDA